IGVRDTIGYRKLEMLHAMNFTLPGVPCIYYGDEYGQPGGNDPDNRRWMEFEGYNVNETRVFETVKKLSSIRKSSMPLIYGDYYPLIVEDDLFVYMRVYMGEYVITALNKSSDLKTANVSLPLNLMYNGKKDMEIVVDPYSFKIYSNKK
ncbi:MAG: alpha-amylase family glycosyl hydrolase, partial [Bacteroidales bacterium]